jgi:DNA repair photolyase
LTRRCLEVLTEADTPFSVVTKGPMVVRDRDVLKRASGRAGAKVYVSVPTVDEEGWRRLEPGTASPAQRLQAARLLRDEGVTTGILMMPLVPGITTSPEQIERTVKAIEAAGVPLVGASLARLDPGVREFFLAFLAREYPELVGEYDRIYQKTRPEYAYGRAVLAMVEAGRRQTGDRS